MYEEDHLIENARKMGALMKELLADLERRHPSIGAARSIGLFGLVELIRNRTTRQPMAPFNGTSDEMAALGRFFRQEETTTFVRWHLLYEPAAVHHQVSIARGVGDLDRGLEIRTRQ